MAKTRLLASHKALHAAVERRGHMALECQVPQPVDVNASLPCASWPQQYSKCSGPCIGPILVGFLDLGCLRPSITGGRDKGYYAPSTSPWTQLLELHVLD